MGPGKVSKKDIENLEALTIEFADELALLNVKVSTLEDGFAELKKDVDGLKKDYAAGGAKAGISGLFQARYVMTDDDPNNTLGKGGAAGAAGTLPLARYVGNAPNGAPNAGNTIAGQGRSFFNIAQSSVGFDRHFDEDFYFHMQLDFDANQEEAFVSGNNVQINEAYVDMEKWLFDGDIRMRVGTWALPFNRERNPEMAEYPNQLRYGFRSLDLTISPSFWDQNWETVRNAGIGLWNGKDSSFQWQIAGTNNTSAGFNSDGSLLAWRQASAAGVGMGKAFGAGHPANTLFVGDPTTRNSVNGASAAGGIGAGSGLYGDSLATIDRNGASASEMGFYGWVGDKYDGGFRWDAGYFQNGGNITPANGDIGTASEWRGYQFNAGWWGWEDWGFMASYYNATSDSALQDIAGGIRSALGGGRNFVGLGLYPALTTASGLAYPDVDSTSWSILANYKFNDENNISVRYEDMTDEMGPAEITARIWTFGWNHKVSNNSLLQLEYSTPESDSRPAAIVGGAVVAGARNTIDVSDDLVQLNYKVRF
ncbi:MAG: hypothetical protein HY303_13785, partial [Candidatus Wallbacteria bacterium]|nr:hypothetical protein [Candidatus Wallbacteria bacterium]